MSKSMKRLVSVIFIFVTVCSSAISTVTRVSCAPQEVYVRYEISYPTPHARYKSMSKEELLALPGAVNYRSEAPTGCSDDDPFVYTVVVVDDQLKAFYEALIMGPATWKMVEEWAYNILEAGDDPFESEFSISFYIVRYERWIIGQVGLLDELHMAQDTFNWPSAYPDSYDCMVIMTANIDGLTVGYSELLGDAFIMSVQAANFFMPVSNLFQHEASHLYGCHDHKGWDALFTWCIMSYLWAPLTRAWCSGCTDTIKSHKYHFGY